MKEIKKRNTSTNTKNAFHTQLSTLTHTSIKIDPNGKIPPSRMSEIGSMYLKIHKRIKYMYITVTLTAQTHLVHKMNSFGKKA